MEKTPFIINELHIHRMPGFQSGLKPFRSLSENINIVSGPNASGKSSSARAIQEVLWQNNKTKYLNAEGWGKTNNDNWRIEIDYNHAKVERNGKEDVLTVPSIEHQSRYMLSLHQLIVEEESDIAKEIAREASGGYDLDAVHKTLNYSDKPKSANIGEYKNYIEKERKHTEILEKQRRIKEEEEQLVQLKQQRDEAKSADLKIKFYTELVNYLNAKSNFKQKEVELSQFPRSVTKVIGNETSNLKEYEEEIEKIKEEVRLAEFELSQHNETLKTLSIPKEGVAEQTQEELEERIAQLKKLENQTQEVHAEIDALQKNEKELLKNIDGHIDPSKWEGITFDNVSELDALYRRISEISGENTLLNTEIKLISEEIEKNETELTGIDKLVSGIEVLANWLKEPISQSTNNNKVLKNYFFTLSIISVITAFLTLFLGWAGLIGLVLLPLIYIFSKKNKIPYEVNALSIRQQDFEKTGLQPPTQWNEEEVIKTLARLVEKLKSEQEISTLKQRLKQVKNQLEENENQFAKVDAKWKKWREKLHYIPEVNNIETNKYSTLYYFITSVQKWQEAKLKRTSKETSLESLKREHKEELDKINNILKVIHFNEISDAIGGEASLRLIRKEEQRRRDTEKDITQKELDISSKKKSLEGYKKKIDDIYEQLNISEKNKQQVEQLISQKKAYEKVKQEFLLAQRETSRYFENLGQYSFFNAQKETIEDMKLDEVEIKISELTEKAEKYDEIQERITTINTKINTQTETNELEIALAEKEEALEALTLVREENISSAVGDLIVKHLKNEVEYKNQPKVFDRANEILSKVTNGRYGLIPLGGETAAFRANDMTYNRSHDLSELSTGTRIQLLLAVRIAYIESIETTIKLPLLIDELLANSDDERAHAIIQTLIEISNNGRQIFYFTAQTDEVKKWEFYLEKEKIKYSIIELETHKKNVNADSFSYKNIDLAPSVPSPNGKTHAAYKAMINVPVFSPSIEETSALHLWYLIDNVELLYACLSKGIYSWGQLRNYLQAKGKIEGMNEEIIAQLHDKIAILTEYIDLYQQGRPKSINRQILSQSGAVSDTFIDEVNALLEESNHNPEELLEKLKNRGVSRFLTNKINELENYLIENEFIDTRERLTEDEISIQLQAFISNKNVNQEEINQFIKRINEEI